MEPPCVGVVGVDGRDLARKRGRVKDGGDGEQPDAKRRASAMVPWAAAAHPHPQHPASRIYRVSRASGGKDRHSKVYTAKGIRDRRVRLSVATAIQFYDLQDRLGYDQPSKAIEWLIKAAADAIDKLPSLDVAAAGFPSHPASSLAAAAANGKDAEEQGGNQQQQLTRSGCSSTSETSKGSVLSLSRSESRVKARKRARERGAAAVTRDKDPPAAAAATTTSSFTELLTGMATEQKQQPAASWAPTADYIGFAAKSTAPLAFASPAPHLVTSSNIGGMAPTQHHFAGLSPGAVTVASGGGGEAEMTQQFSFLQQDHFMPTAVHASAPAAAADYNLNFSMSSGLVAVNSSRGTLQSNSHVSSGHHQHHQLQRLSATPLDSNIPFLFSPAPTAADTQFAAAFQLWNGFHHHHAADIKEKGKN